MDHAAQSTIHRIIADTLNDLGLLTEPSDGRVVIEKLVAVSVDEFRIAISFAADFKLMEMGLGPSHCCLDAFTQ